MRKVILTIFFFLLIGWQSPLFAKQYLAADYVTNVTASEVEVDGTVVPGMILQSADGLSILLLDVDGFSPGPHVFKARIQDTSGWWSAWSSPLDASRPDASILRVVDQ